MKNLLKIPISHYGQSITIMNANKETISTSTALIQPLRSDYQSPLYKDYQENDNTEQFLYIGLPETDLNSLPSDTLIESDSIIYKIKKIESFRLSDPVLYERAVLEKYTSEEN